MKLRLLNGVLLFAISSSSHVWGFPLVSDRHYATYDGMLYEFDRTGALISQTYHPDESLRGVAIGPKGYLYVVASPYNINLTPRVDVFDELGQKIKDHPFTGTLSMNAATGKIAFSEDGRTFYVGATNGIYRFAVEGASGSLLASDPTFDIDVLPNGDLLVAEGNRITRRSPSGIVLSEFSAISDPQQLSGASSIRLADTWGIAYSAKERRTYVTMLGSFRLIALDDTSNVLSHIEYYWYGNDMFVSTDDKLIVGSRTQAPGRFNLNLQFLGQFGGSAGMFVGGFPALISRDGFD